MSESAAERAPSAELVGPDTSQHPVNRSPSTASPGCLRWFFGIGPATQDSVVPPSRLIYPLSVFGLLWVSITALFLAYTAVVTPPVIAYHWLDPECATVPTLYFDTALDCFFLLDIIINFNTGIIYGGEYIDDRRKVVVSYLRGYFLFDVCTSFPVSFFELIAAAECAKDGAGEAVGGGQLRIIRAIKPLRFFKIARIMKLGKAGPLVELIMDYLNISPNFGRGLKALTSLCICIHLLSCLWWLWKVNSNPEDDVHAFLDSLPWGMHERNDISTVRGKLEAYVVSVYVTTMTLTTVGYGDVTADNTSERVGYVLFFIVNALMWGNLLAEVGEIHQSASARSQTKMEAVQSTLDFLMENDCPASLRTEIIQWTRFSMDHVDSNVKKKQMIDRLPPNLQKGLVRHLYSGDVSRVPVFNYIESLDRSSMHEDFLNKIFLSFEYKTFTPDEILVNFSDPADRLIYLVSGKVTVDFDGAVSRDKMMLKDGDYVGDMAILGYPDWADSTCFHFPPNKSDELTEIRVQACPAEYVVVLQLLEEDFGAALEESSAITQASISEFSELWENKRAHFEEGESRDMKAVRFWERIVLRLRRTRLQVDGQPQSGFQGVSASVLKEAAKKHNQSFRGQKGSFRRTRSGQGSEQRRGSETSEGLSTGCKALNGEQRRLEELETFVRTNAASTAAAVARIEASIMNISILLRGSVPPAIDGTDDDGAADGGGGDEGGGDAGGVPRQSARRRKANLAGEGGPETPGGPATDAVRAGARPSRRSRREQKDKEPTKGGEEETVQNRPDA